METLTATLDKLLYVNNVLTLFSSRACYGVLRFIMESGAKGCEVVVSGKLRGQRAKSMKFVDGLMIHSGDPVNYYVDTAVRHVLLRQGEYRSTRDTATIRKTQQLKVSAGAHRKSLRRMHFYFNFVS